MSQQIQPHQIILAEVVARSTGGANSHFNSSQENTHSHMTHFEDIIVSDTYLQKTDIKHLSLSQHN